MSNALKMPFRSDQIEYRISKSETNPKYQMTKIQNRFEHSNL
jgi:hypothetical protein